MLYPQFLILVGTILGTEEMRAGLFASRSVCSTSSSLSYDASAAPAATRYRHAFDVVMTLAISGYHFQTLTRIA